MAVVRKDPAEQQPQAVSAKVSVLWTVVWVKPW